MAATSTTIQDFNKNFGNEVMNRQEIQAALAKAVELRALHATLMQQGSSPASAHHNKLSSASPVSHNVSHLSAQDYPVFTPSYEEEPLPGYQQIRLQNRNYAESWDECGPDGDGDDCNLSSYNNANANLPSMKGYPGDFMNVGTRVCPNDDQRSISNSSANNINLHRVSPGADFCKSRRNSLGDLKSVSSCNNCRPAKIRSEDDFAAKSTKSSNFVVPLTDTHSSVHSQPKNRGLNLLRLFPSLKKKNKNKNSPNRSEPEEVSQILKDFGLMSIETMKKELMEANERRDKALSEVSEMRSSIGELNQKLEHLENYCEELKKALRQAAQTKSSQVVEKLGNLSKQGKSSDGNGENRMPVSEETMVEGFLQIVSEARLSVKQFCKILLAQIEENDDSLRDNLNMLLQPYNLSLNSKYTRPILYHLEATINDALFQDFENCVFQKNGSPKFLDPHQECVAQFSSFVALRNLSWNEVLRKGTKYYSEDFSKFCDQKMSLIIATLNWIRPWPEQLLQAFFVAAKCIWLLHLLAFSFNPALGIIRVEENRTFDPHYMEDIFMDKQKAQGGSRVKIMVMPGFYVHDRVLRCKVLCRYKSVRS
ncbi:OLC1v1005808C1 [Oldenlandia corymbosa var. corymbosa]|uniref:OLC1v1005808C1 n=1 Tax=Oldenlandia corymbosa var. corymbosa TaxID=529605 RepID=A0AAV1DFE5_OLDCO|nr:OLC1v1005808C1 [Oldenlandia corymbosa var. corymbosa]